VVSVLVMMQLTHQRNHPRPHDPTTPPPQDIPTHCPIRPTQGPTPKRPALTTHQPTHPSPNPCSSPSPHISTAAHGTEQPKHPIHPTHTLAGGFTEASSKENKALQAQEVESTGTGT
jgi:hypothetical protein